MGSTENFVKFYDKNLESGGPLNGEYLVLLTD